MNNPDILHISLDDNGWYIVDEVGDESTTKYHSDDKYKALEARMDAAEKVSRHYFEIAAEVIGEDEVRARLNARIDK